MHGAPPRLSLIEAAQDVQCEHFVFVVPERLPILLRPDEVQAHHLRGDLGKLVG